MNLTRLLDILLSTLGLFVASPVLITICIIGAFDTGAPLFRQVRIGRWQRPFVLVKFRTMKRVSVSVPTHVADASLITQFGRLLRRSKLDELPQMWNVLKGDMSMVGPRPCLVNQIELIEERARRNVFSVRPGITGLAQLEGIDMSTPVLLAEADSRMLSNLTLGAYIKYLFLSLLGRGSGDRVRDA